MKAWCIVHTMLLSTISRLKSWGLKASLFARYLETENSNFCQLWWSFKMYKASDDDYDDNKYILEELFTETVAKSEAFDPHDFYLGVTHATVKIGF